MQRRLAGCRAAMDDQRVAQAAVATAEDALHQRPHSRTVVAFISGDFCQCFYLTILAVNHLSKSGYAKTKTLRLRATPRS